jgi:hypothetical protein
MSLYMSVETITPNLASEYLKVNTCNRPMRQSRVDQLAREMQAGQWGLTHQGVAFNCDGTLLDGQHRLAAIVQANVPVRMVVTRGVRQEMQLFMDDHAKRTANDSLSLYRGEQITKQDVAVLRAATELSAQSFSLHASNAELNVALDTFRDALLFCHNYSERKRNRGIGAAPVWGAVALAWFYVTDLDRLQQFCSIVSGDAMAKNETDNAPHLLREWLLKNGLNGGPMRQEAFKKTQRAIKAFMERTALTRLCGNTHHYPYPLVNPVRVSNKENMK